MALCWYTVHIGNIYLKNTLYLSTLLDKSSKLWTQTKIMLNKKLDLNSGRGQRWASIKAQDSSALLFKTARVIGQSLCARRRVFSRATSARREVTSSCSWWLSAIIQSARLSSCSTQNLRFCLHRCAAALYTDTLRSDLNPLRLWWLYLSTALTACELGQHHFISPQAQNILMLDCPSNQQYGFTYDSWHTVYAYS